MKTGFQRFQQTVQRQRQQHQRQLQGGYWLMKKRERELQQQQRATPARRFRSSMYATPVTPAVDYDDENPIVWLIKLPFRIVSFVIKAVVTLAVVGFILFVAAAVLSALLG